MTPLVKGSLVVEMRAGGGEKRQPEKNKTGCETIYAVLSADRSPQGIVEYFHSCQCSPQDASS
jgi:hypothetical protein